MTIGFERSTLGQIRIHVLPTDRFKTFAMSVYIGQPLDEQTVTQVALVPFVLRRGTERLPETSQFRQKLDDLYGAGFGFDIYKRGNYQLVQFRMDIIDDKYVSASESLLAEGLRYIGEALTRPAIEDGHFLNKYVAAEKLTVRKRIEAVINDKMRYAAERCIEEMYENDPYRLRAIGQIDDLNVVTPEGLHAFYQEWLRTAPIDVYVVGRTTLAEVERLVADAFNIDGAKSRGMYVNTAPQRLHRDPKTIVERMDVGQGKLNMGLRANVTYADDAYVTALMYNGVLGGYPHSKLFMNVRERASLAYYASSRFDGHKGFVAIQSGIEIEKYAQAVAIIEKQLEAMREGEISDSEMKLTRAMLGNHLREIRDSAFELASLDFNSVLSGRQRTVDSLLYDLEHVDVAAIRAAAEKVQLDTIYFLRNDKGE